MKTKTATVGSLLLTAALAAHAQAPAPAASAVTIDSETISGLGARNIGSAAMSGRVAAIDAVRDGDRLTVFIGAASGGVWKSVNGGTTYKPVFDKQAVQSIGAVTVDPTNPKVVWVGTGEAWTRNSVSIGDGIYKSVDGGENWTNVGLAGTERIVKILVDPTAPDTVYACAPGKLWSDSDERGVFKTTDGGKTWTKVLAGRNLSTGCSMISLDRQNPKTLYAGMWDFRRKGWTFRSGGDGENAPSASGLFKSQDGGATWSELDEKSVKGLPSKPWGRVAVTVAPSRPSVVYAFIEAAVPKNGLYRSDDGGATWQAMDRSQMMVWRPFYFANLIVDPKDENKLYKPDLSLIASNDGGKSFSDIGGGAHGDFHDVWIDPSNTDRLIAGDDGGVWYSYDGGNKWWKADNLPISQFYHVSLDMERPYNVYGGLQDNSSWVGMSAYPGGITNAQWENMYGGDGFWMFADTADSTFIYAESQGGEIGRVNRKTHETRAIKPLPGYKEGKLRYNWNTPIHMSPTQKGVVYIGAQFLFRSRDHGQTWDRISPDLTTNDPEKQKQEQSGGVTVDNSAAEMHTTIYSIAESPKDPNLIWVGTDDGNVQLTRDGGKTWTNVAGNISGLPKSAWVSSVEAGHFAAGTAYATFDLHTFGDMKPYVYRTTDFGKTWTALAPADGSMKGYAHVVKEDPVDAKLLFVGTELGLWVSLDGGRRWAQYKGGDLPNVAVRDVAVHPRDSSLVLATHGRGIWIVDDITPLRSLTEDMLARDATFVAGQPVVQRIRAFGGWGWGDAAFEAPESLLRRPDRLLPEEAPHLRRPEDRGPRTGRQAPDDPADEQAPRPLALELDNAVEGPARPPGGVGRLRRQQRAPRPSRDLHGPDDEGQEGLRDEDRARPGSALQAHARGPQGAVRARHEALRDARRHDLRRRSHQWRPCRSRGAGGEAARERSSRARAPEGLVGGRLASPENRRHQGGRHDHRRGAPARRPDGSLLERHHLRGPPLRDPGPADRRDRPGALRRGEGVRRVGGQGAARPQPGARGQGTAPKSSS